MRNQKRKLNIKIVVYGLIAVFVVVWLISLITGERTTDKLFTVGKNTVTKDEMLWKYHHNEYSNLVLEELKNEVFIENVKLDKEVKKRVEKNILAEAEVKNKNEYLKKLDVTKEVFDRKVEAKTALVQLLISKSKISNKDIGDEIDKQSTLSLYQVFVANDTESKKIKEELKKGLNLENATQKANDEYHLSYLWNVSLGEIINEYGLEDSQIDALLNLKVAENEIIEQDGAVLFIELTGINNLEPNRLYINSVQKLAEEKGITEQTLFNSLKEKTKIKYHDEKYFK